MHGHGHGRREPRTAKHATMRRAASLLLPRLLVGALALGSLGSLASAQQNFHTPVFQSDAVDGQTCYRLQVTSGRELVPPLPLLPLTHLADGTPIASLAAVYPYTGPGGVQGPRTGLEAPNSTQAQVFLAKDAVGQVHVVVGFFGEDAHVSGPGARTAPQSAFARLSLRDAAGAPLTSTGISGPSIVDDAVDPACDPAVCAGDRQLFSAADATLRVLAVYPQNSADGFALGPLPTPRDPDDASCVWLELAPPSDLDLALVSGLPAAQAPPAEGPTNVSFLGRVPTADQQLFAEAPGIVHTMPLADLSLAQLCQVPCESLLLSPVGPRL